MHSKSFEAPYGAVTPAEPPAPQKRGPLEPPLHPRADLRATLREPAKTIRLTGKDWSSSSKSSSSTAEPTPFHSTDEAKTLSELLVSEHKLADHASEYARVLESAGVDAELAAELELADLRELLPAAPIAHCLMIKRRLSARTEIKPVIPNSPAWKWTARVVANGVREGNIKEFSGEIVVMAAALFLIFLQNKFLHSSSHHASI